MPSILMWTQPATAAIAASPCARLVFGLCATFSIVKIAWPRSSVILRPRLPPRQAAPQAGVPHVPGPVAALPPAPFPGVGPNPVLAFFLGFLPGLGAFYNEQYGKGMIHLAIFLLLFITGVNGLDNGGAEAALWICVAALWVYMPIDALRTAQAKRAGLPLSDPLDNFSRQQPIGPIILIGVGILLLLNNFEWFQWYRVARFWPLILIGVGILMFRNRIDRQP